MYVVGGVLAGHSWHALGPLTADPNWEIINK